jgi:hypothetical protein
MKKALKKHKLKTLANAGRLADQRKSSIFLMMSIKGPKYVEVNI